MSFISSFFFSALLVVLQLAIVCVIVYTQRTEDNAIAFGISAIIGLFLSALIYTYTVQMVVKAETLRDFVSDLQIKVAELQTEQSNTLTETNLKGN